jgi:polysaccharide export outer membrane protein
MRKLNPNLCIGSVLLFCFPCLFCQLVLGAETLPAEASAQQLRATYTLGPEDLIIVRGMHADEVIDKPFRVEADGNISLPMVGHMRAGGLSIEEFQAALTDQLKRFYKDPQISVNISEFRSQPVSVGGAVTHPGVLQLQGSKSILEILSMVGGVRPDAGPVVKITRAVEWGPIPVEGSHLDETGKFSLAELSLRDLMSAKRPAGNILVRPHDVISVPTSAIVYVLGQVKKTGGFVLGSRPSLSVLEAISMAEGLNPRAAPKNARILRIPEKPGERREEIAVDVKKIFAGKAPDIALRGDDILYIPTSVVKSAALRSIEAGVSIGTGLMIYR